MTKKASPNEIEPWDDFNEVDLSKKRYVSDAQIDANKKRRISRDELLRRFKKVHGDRYDYSKVEYVNLSIDVIITCPIHGEFIQNPRDHLRGRGCRYASCGGKIIDRDTAIQRFKKVHGDKYDYSKVEYVDWKTDIIIICPDHGEFIKKPFNHAGGIGCPSCGSKLRSTSAAKTNKKRTLSEASVIAAFREMHGDRYDYSKVVYNGRRQKVIIICKEHGEFLQSSSNHTKGAGCPSCGRISAGKARMVS